MSLDDPESSSGKKNGYYYQILAIILLISTGLYLPSCNREPDNAQLNPENTTTSSIKVQVDPSGMEMALIPAGDVILIEEDHIYRTSTEVTYAIDGFYLDIHEVTNEQYARCISAGKCIAPEHNSIFANPDYADHPVINVTKDMAESYCDWREARLPISLEWEKAAQDELLQVDYFWGDRSPICLSGAQLPIFPQAYTKLDSITSPTKSSLPNMYGLYDMTGSMWEWVDDESYGETAQPDTQLPTIGYLRMFRNGGYGPQYESFFCSFRCALDQ